MGTKATLEISEEWFATIDKELSGLAVFSRMKTVKAGMRKAGKVVERRYKDILPRPEHTGKKADKPHLEDTLAVKVKEYASGNVVSIVGAQWILGGKHAHLVEEGHRMVRGGKVAPTNKPSSGAFTGSVIGRVEGKHYLAKAVSGTKGEVESIFIETILAGVEEAKKGPPAGT